MRSIGAEFISQLESGYLTPFTLFEFTDGDNWYRYTNLDVSITVATDSTTEYTYTPIGFNVDLIQYSMGIIVDEANVTVDNIDQVMTVLFGGPNIQGNQANIWYGVLDINDAVVDVLNIFTGEIDLFTIEEDKLTLKIGSYFSKWSHKAISRHGSSCRLRVFKGKECQYVGPELECGRLYHPDCIGYSNTENFAGFRFVNELEDKIITWGRNT